VAAQDFQTLSCFSHLWRSENFRPGDFNCWFAILVSLRTSRHERSWATTDTSIKKHNQSPSLAGKYSKNVVLFQLFNWRVSWAGDEKVPASATKTKKYSFTSNPDYKLWWLRREVQKLIAYMIYEYIYIYNYMIKYDNMLLHVDFAITKRGSC